ncbi:hypothetical protein PR048_028797 [Dryococelus australis]|uniref:Uncharacterized protein n=1 Tax=Dryococelus australis TaxID=614101 RepID=A0ABQ9GF93_9NEOP|nr:hypothetical protein PR048_028797 [Dryococelus australis]
MKVIEVNMERRRNEGGGKREIPEKTRRPTASSGTISTCENPVTRPGLNLFRLDERRAGDGEPEPTGCHVVTSPDRDVGYDHEESIDDNDYEGSVNEVSDEKDEDPLYVLTPFTNEFPSTSGVKKSEGVKNARYIFPRRPQ